MRHRPHFVAALIAVCVFTFVSVTRADVKLASLFADNAVLQRQKPINVWGWAEPGEKVTVKLGDKEASADADKDGKWSLQLPAMEAGGPVELTAVGSKSPDKAVNVKNLLIGEVWICSGQSNMEWTVGGAKNAKEEIAAANFPKMRFVKMPHSAPWTPQAVATGPGNPSPEVKLRWAEVSPASAAGCTAVGFFFGRKLHQDLDVPIGLIDSSWGGTLCEAWTSLDALAATPELRDMAEAQAERAKRGPDAVKKFETAKALWDKENATVNTLEFDDSKWKQVTLPRERKEGQTYRGWQWYRKVVEIPTAWGEKDLVIKLGPIDDSEMTYFNGTKIGETQAKSGEPSASREYIVPGKLVKPGKAIIAIKANDVRGMGGLGEAADGMTLSPVMDDGDKKSVSLAGEWRVDGRIAQTPPPKAPDQPGNPHIPGVLFNGMIAPHIPYSIRGAIWYQGESNAGRPDQYRVLFPTMIKDWRARFDQGDFPFYFVQLANYMGVSNQPVEEGWAGLRDAQLATLKLPNTGMACIIDIGEGPDIHPKNKQDVGLRLALWALADTYGKKAVVKSGPLYESMKIEGEKIRITFKHTGGGLVAKGDGPLKRFAIAGEDKKWVHADAVIDGNTVVVSNASVTKPVAVRYAWANNPEGCNLYNKEGLPASPFRTDGPKDDAK